MAPLAGAQMRTDGVYIGGNRIITTTIRAISDPDRRQYDRHSGAHRDCIHTDSTQNAWPDRLSGVTVKFIIVPACKYDRLCCSAYICNDARY
jgi:hypothetical protein